MPRHNPVRLWNQQVKPLAVWSRLTKVLGQTPIAFVRRLRVERAIFLLETTDESVESIAGQVGYRDGVTLRTQTGLGIRQLRRQAE